MKTLLKLSLFVMAMLFVSCNSSTLLDEDGDQIAIEGVSIIEQPPSVKDVLEPDVLIDTAPEGIDPAQSILDDAWQDDFVSPSAAVVGSTKWKKGKTIKTVRPLSAGYYSKTTLVKVTTSGRYKLKIKQSSGYFYSVKTTSSSADFTVPPAYESYWSTCAIKRNYVTEFTRTDYEYKLNLVGNSKIWQQTGVTRIVEDAKPRKYFDKRFGPWTSDCQI